MVLPTPNEKYYPLATQIDWNATWLYLNNNHKKSSSYTNFKLCQEKTFKIKLIFNLLSILPNLHSIYPQYFPNINYISCNSHESQMHWLTCPNASNLNTIITNTIQHFLQTSRLDITNTQIQELHDKLTHHPSLSLTYYNKNNTNIFTTIQEFISTMLIQTIKEYTDSNKTAMNTTVQLLLQLSQNIYNLT